MQVVVRRLSPQPLIACLLSVLAVVPLVAVWLTRPLLVLTPGTVLLLGFLLAGVVTAYQFPIHINQSNKLIPATISIYLMVALLPAAPAALAIGLGILIGELLARARGGNLYSDVVTSTSRWVIVALAGSLGADLAGGSPPVRLVLIALILWVGDTLTAPLLVAPMTGDRPFRVLLAGARGSLPGEAMQYLIGLLSALVAVTAPWALVLSVPPAALVYLTFKNVKELHISTRQMLESLADTIDLRDPYTGGHSRRVAELTAGIVRELKIWGPEAELIIAAARIHDIGKIGVPDYVLNKTGRLTPEEQAIMQTHAARGADLMLRYPDFARGAAFIRHHHESWDGTGYPTGLKGMAIPFGARVIAVADSFDAMTTDRPYRKALPAEQAAWALRQGCDQQWDGVIVAAFLRSIGEGRALEGAQQSQVISSNDDGRRPTPAGVVVS